MGKVKQINVKNRTYYFYNDQINLTDFDARLLKVDKKDYTEIDIYYIGYVTVKIIANCNNINSVRKRRQLGFVTLNSNLAVNLKPTHPTLLNARGQFTFLMTKSSHSSGIVVYPPKFEFLRNL